MLYFSRQNLLHLLFGLGVLKGGKPLKVFTVTHLEKEITVYALPYVIASVVSGIRGDWLLI